MAADVQVLRPEIVQEDEAIDPKTLEKRANFRRLAQARTNRALDAITQIGHLSNRYAYEYEEGEVRKIIRALREAVSTVESRFSPKQQSPNGRFVL